MGLRRGGADAVSTIENQSAATAEGRATVKETKDAIREATDVNSVHALLLTACAASKVVVPARSACSSLVPAEWEKGVEHAPAPSGTGVLLDQYKAWAGFGVDQSARLD